MTPRHSAKNRRNRASRCSDRLVSVRSAVVLLLALLSGLGAAVLLYLAHRSVPLIVLSSAGIVALAMQFFDGMIDSGSP